MISINYSTIQVGASLAYSSLTSATAADKNEAAQTNQSWSSPSTLVNISPQAQEKLAQEKSELGQKLAKQIQPDSTEDIKNNESESTKLLDKLIEETQEKIKEAQQELRALKSNNTEEAKQEQKMLESQIMSLSALLIGLLGKKLEALEQ